MFRPRFTSVVILCICIALSFVSYFGLWHTYYQQDEWQTLGHNIVEGIGIVTKDVSIPQFLLAEGRLLSRIFYFVFLRDAKSSVIPLFLVGILIHGFNGWLLFLIIKKFNIHLFGLWAAVIFFIVNNVSAEAVTWAAAVGTLPATTLLLLSLLWYVDFLDTENIRKRNGAFIMGILSLFFKETGLFLFLFYPFLYLLWGRSRGVRDVLTVHAPLLLYGTALVIFRVAELLYAPNVAAGFVDNQKGGYIFSILYHAIVYPLTSFSQVFVAPLDMYAFVPRVVRSEYPYLLGTPLFDLAGQSTVTDTVSLLGTFFFAAAIGYVMAGKKEPERNRKFVIVSSLLFLLSFLPYAVLHRYFSYFSSRYYYVGVIGAACLYGYAASWLFKRLSWFLRVLLLIGVGFYLSYHVQAIRKDLDRQIVIASERKTFLKEVKRLHPALQNQTAFYITSDKKYLGEITYPFQNGLGYILEVLYYDTGNIPKSFLASNFLWDLGSEGFRETEGSGFGYFEHIDKLGEAVKEGKVSPDIVYGYFYNSQMHALSDITLPVRQKLATLSGTLR